MTDNNSSVDVQLESVVIMTYRCEILGVSISVPFPASKKETQEMSDDLFWLSFVAPFFSTLPNSLSAFLEYKSRFCNPVKHASYKTRPFDKDEEAKFTAFLATQYENLASCGVTSTKLTVQELSDLIMARKRKGAKVLSTFSQPLFH